MPPHPLAATRLFKSGAAAAAPRMRWLAADSAELSASRVRACAWRSLEIEGETFPHLAEPGVIRRSLNATWYGSSFPDFFRQNPNTETFHLSPFQPLVARNDQYPFGRAIRNRNHDLQCPIVEFNRGPVTVGKPRILSIF